jgi:hypothetical protein
MILFRIVLKSSRCLMSICRLEAKDYVTYICVFVLCCYIATGVRDTACILMAT